VCTAAPLCCKPAYAAASKTPSRWVQAAPFAVRRPLLSSPLCGRRPSPTFALGLPRKAEGRCGPCLRALRKVKHFRVR